MAYVVEDGTGLATATGMVSAEDATAYLETKYDRRGQWFRDDATDPTREAYLMQAAEILNELSYRGERARSAQAMPFPRNRCQRDGALDGAWWPSNAVPTPMANANADLAWHLAENPRLMDRGEDDSGPQRLPDSTLRLVRPFIGGPRLRGPW